MTFEDCEDCGRSQHACNHCTAGDKTLCAPCRDKHLNNKRKCGFCDQDICNDGSAPVANCKDCNKEQPACEECVAELAANPDAPGCNICYEKSQGTPTEVGANRGVQAARAEPQKDVCQVCTKEYLLKELHVMESKHYPCDGRHVAQKMCLPCAEDKLGKWKNGNPWCDYCNGVNNGYKVLVAVRCPLCYKTDKACMPCVAKRRMEKVTSKTLKAEFAKKPAAISADRGVGAARAARRHARVTVAGLRKMIADIPETFDDHNVVYFTDDEGKIAKYLAFKNAGLEIVNSADYDLDEGERTEVVSIN